MFSVVQAFTYGRRGRRHAVVLSSHASADEAFLALDSLLAHPPSDTEPQALSDCYVVDADHNPVHRPRPNSGEPGSSST